MTVIRAGVLAARYTGALISFLALLTGCGRVASDAEQGGGGSDRAGAFGDAGMPNGGSNDGRAGAPVLPSGGAESSAGSGAGGLGGASGSSPGDAGAAGAAGDHSAIDLPLPADCEADAHTATDTSCSLNVTCHGEPSSIDCQRLASGDWQCSCAPTHSERTLEISGAAGLQACAVAAGLCTVSELTVGEETCTETPDYPHDDQCGLDLSCRKSIVTEQPPGVRASLVQSGRAVCGQLVAPTVAGGQAPYTCTCFGSPRQDYIVLDNDAAHTCRSVLDFCLSGKQPSFVATSGCTANSDSLDAGHCKSLQLCGRQMPLSGAASLIEPLPQRSLSCDSLESGDLSCTCAIDSTEATSVGSGYSFHVPVVTVSTCDPALCRPDVAPEPTGPVGDCQPQPHDIGVDTCAVPFACPVPALVEGHALTIDAPLSVSCAKRTADDTWWCSCGSGANTTQFELGAAADSEGACGLAPPHCLAQISLQLGPAQWGGPPLPNPLP